MSGRIIEITSLWEMADMSQLVHSSMLIVRGAEKVIAYILHSWISVET